VAHILSSNIKLISLDRSQKAEKGKRCGVTPALSYTRRLASLGVGWRCGANVSTACFHNAHLCWRLCCVSPGLGSRRSNAPSGPFESSSHERTSKLAFEVPPWEKQQLASQGLLTESTGYPYQSSRSNYLIRHGCASDRINRLCVVSPFQACCG
jgi:hypothetical protein